MFSRLAAPASRHPVIRDRYPRLHVLPVTDERRSRPSPRKDLRASMGDAATFSLMVGLGETYLAAFALALGSGEIAAGLLAAVPMLAGSLLQLISPWAVRRLGSHRRWVVACAACQAFSLFMVPLAVPAGSSGIWLVFLAATLYWATGMATGPAWNTWMDEIIPKPVRTRYFARRVRISQVCVLAGFGVGGLALEAGQASGWTMATFSALFLLAGICRLISTMFLAIQSEPSAGKAAQWDIGLRQLSSRLRGHAGAQLLLYLMAVQITVQMAGPYFTPYMIRELRLSYVQYMALIAFAFIGKVITLPAWGKLAHYSGARRLLWIGGLAVVPISGLWVFADSFLYLACVQLVAGTVWAAYELAMVLMFFEAIPREERTSLLTAYNVGNSVAMVLGAVLGAVLLHTMGVNHGSGHTPYLVLFGLSALARLLTVVLLVRLPDLRFEAIPPAIRTLSVRPADGTTDPPILPSLPDEPTAASER